MKYRLKKDLPDLMAGAIGESGEDNDGNQILRIKSQNPDRESWSFFRDEITNFDEWFEEVA